MILDSFPFLAFPSPLLKFCCSLELLTLRQWVAHFVQSAISLIVYLEKTSYCSATDTLIAFAFASKQHKRSEKENAGANFTHTPNKKKCHAPKQ
jgi:hypothetical protein